MGLQPTSAHHQALLLIFLECLFSHSWGFHSQLQLCFSICKPDSHQIEGEKALSCQTGARTGREFALLHSLVVQSTFAFHSESCLIRSSDTPPSRWDRRSPLYKDEPAT